MLKRGMKPQQAVKLRERSGLKITKLQRLRVAKGLSQNDLATLSGVPLRRIQGYEQQKRPIDSARLDSLCNLAIALDVKIEDILESKNLINRFRLSK